MRSTLITALAAALTSQCFAVNIVVNGDFQANSYPANGHVTPTTPAGWTVLGLGNVAGIGVGYLQAPSQEIDVSGTFDQAGSGITQVLPTVAGQLYVISFDVYTGGVTGHQGGVTVEMGATTLGTNLQGLNTGNGRKKYTFNHVALANNEAITFKNAQRNVSHIDNVEVVPEPMTLLALGGGIAALARRRRR